MMREHLNNYARFSQNGLLHLIFVITKFYGTNFCCCYPYMKSLIAKQLRNIFFKMTLLVSIHSVSPYLPYNIIDFYQNTLHLAQKGAQSCCCAAKQLLSILVALQNSLLHPRLTNDVQWSKSSLCIYDWYY